ncbi:energy transducer TonB [Qipengyuania sp. 1NDH17]|uniref:Energy transducer TonB n=1 Tax=Qipengyuania polymorpha TaxID=2867234 RepID=A0ABS7IZY1_9SPHN|nr:energy transducer TonB [Qipengyuania polymorpha]MBX7459138.1 energy transducer TonB [Qipengyuania polymorpha]
MERTGIRAEEKTGLIVAVVLHLAVLALLLVQAMLPAPIIPKTERMTVSLAEDVGLEATAPDPVEESSAAIAPTLSDSPAPAPEILDAPSEPVVERPTKRVQSPVPAPGATTKPRRETPRETAKPKSSETGGGSRIGQDFLAGSGDSTRTSETRTPASQIGSQAKASLFQAVGRQLRPHWRPVDGADRELLVSQVRFRLNPDGSLNGSPVLRGQRGVTDANRAQAGRHGENAIRAVQLAAPFDLPPEYYEAWKVVTVDFDWKLSQ